ncbi:hypothetical protein Glove_634g21 [Diversispora epigaea]|uniref:PSI domain-containing protein n=1 Tax=Diversispora epigaea TaxID=1348612 RepID=A0A397G508_9GLOM|nr:hypothetical protein Glove_634g21 [Diversispora epigaea]
MRKYLFTTFLCYLCLFTFYTLAVNLGIRETSSIEIPTPTQIQHDSSEITIPPAKSHNDSCQLTEDCSCHVIGDCEPCDENELETEKYCNNYGNKEPIKCQWINNNTDHTVISLPKFQSCRRVKKVERAKYFEFQFANIVFAFLSCTLLFYRRRKLAADGYRKLVGRIGSSIL